MEFRSRWWERFVPPFTLAGITAFIYSFTLHYDFQFDDLQNIRSHFAIRNEKFWKLAFKAPRWISYWINTRQYALGGFDPLYYRGFNVLIHITTGLLIYYIVRNMLSRLKNQPYFVQRADIISFVTAFLFLLHPVQTQTVSYVVQGQLEGLAGFFMMLLIWIFLQMTQAHNHIVRYSLMGLLFGVGYVSCGTKEIAILSPIMLLLIDWFFVAQGKLERIKWRIPFYLFYTGMIGYVYLRFLKPQFFKSALTGSMTIDNNIGNIITENPAIQITPWHYFISQFKVIVHYIVIFLWPFGLSVDYDWKMVNGFFTTECLAPLGLLLTLLGATLWLLTRNKIHPVAFGALWFFIGLAPRSTFIPSTELLADYKTYFSSFGGLFLLSLLVVALFEWIKEQIAKTDCPSLVHHPYTAFGFCALLLGAATYQRNLVWSSSEAFWLDVLQHSPLKARAHNNYGTALGRLGKHREALQSFKRAIKLDPFYPDPHNNQAVTYEKLGNIDRAIETMHYALKMHQDYPEFYNNLGVFALKKQEYDKVEQYCKIALQKRPHYGKAFYNIGRAKYAQGKFEEAYEMFYSAVFKADFDDARGYEGLGNASMKLKKYDIAIESFERALALGFDNNATALFNTANAHFCKGNYERAGQLYQKMVQIDPSDTRGWYNLGEVSLMAQEAQKALTYFEKAAPLVDQYPDLQQRVAQCRVWAQKEAQGEKVVIS